MTQPLPCPPAATPEPVAPSPSQVHIVFSHLPDHDPPRFIEVENAEGKSINFGEWRMRPDGLAELVFPAPTPSPDIAGLVEWRELTPEQAEACVYLAHRVLGKDSFAPDHARVLLELLADFERGYKEAATALQRVAQERDAANQLNNKYAWERDKAREERDAAERRSEAFWKPQLTAAEARLSSARDEGLEKAAGKLDARVTEIAVEYGSYEPDTNYTNLPEWAEGVCEELDTLAAGIRALKGPKP